MRTRGGIGRKLAALVQSSYLLACVMHALILFICMFLTYLFDWKKEYQHFCWYLLYMKFLDETIGVEAEILANRTFFVTIVVPRTAVAVFASTVVQLFDDFIDRVGAGDDFNASLDGAVLDESAELHETFVSGQRSGDSGPFTFGEFTGAKIVFSELNGELGAICHGENLLMVFIHDYTRESLLVLFGGNAIFLGLTAALM